MTQATTNEAWVVQCMGDRSYDGDGYEWVLSTRTIFTSEKLALDYAATIHQGRHPRILPLAQYLTSFEKWRIK